MLQAIGNESLAGDSQPIDVLAWRNSSYVSSGASPTLQTVVSDLNGIYGAGTYAYDPTYDPTDGNSTGNGPSGLIYNTKTVQDLGGAISLGHGTSGATAGPDAIRFAAAWRRQFIPVLSLCQPCLVGRYRELLE